MFADKNQWIIQGKKYTECSSHSAAQPGLTLAGGREVEPAWLGGILCDPGALQTPVKAEGSWQYLEPDSGLTLSSCGAARG